MIKVLVVDDSAFMRQIFKKTINNDPELNVIATARNGKKALELIEQKKPDIVTLDIEMPVLNGIDTLKIIRKKHPEISVIMLSAMDNKETVLQALEIGAFDFIPKPSGEISLNIDDIKKQMITKIKAASKSKIFKEDYKTPSKNYTGIKGTKYNYPVIAIGTSSGGPKALKSLLKPLPADLPAAIVIVQHMPEGFTTSLANHLNELANLNVKEASSNDLIKPGTVLLAPGNYHLLITEKGRIRLNQKPKKWGVRPCIDYMMISSAQIYKERVIGVILTGMGHDGALGMKEIKKYNGYGIVEARDTALVYGMPGSTIKEKAYDEITPLYDIPGNIIKQIERSNY